MAWYDQKSNEIGDTAFVKTNICFCFIVDWDFDECMNDAEINSLSKQLMFGYAENRKATKPVNLVFTGCKGERFKSQLQVQSNGGWNVDVHEKCYTEVFDKDKLVYLTADSEHTLERFEEDKIYIYIYKLI